MWYLINKIMILFVICLILQCLTAYIVWYKINEHLTNILTHCKKILMEIHFNSLKIENILRYTEKKTRKHGSFRVMTPSPLKHPCGTYS